MKIKLKMTAIVVDEETGAKDFLLERSDGLVVLAQNWGIPRMFTVFGMAPMSLPECKKLVAGWDGRPLDKSIA